MDSVNHSEATPIIFVISDFPSLSNLKPLLENDGTRIGVEMLLQTFDLA